MPCDVLVRIEPSLGVAFLCLEIFLQNGLAPNINGQWL